MKIQGNYNRLIQIDTEFAQFRQHFPHVALLIDRISKFQEKNAMRLKTAKERYQEIGNKYISKDENGNFRVDDKGYVFSLPESKEQFEKEITELNQIQFDIYL